MVELARARLALAVLVAACSEQEPREPSRPSDEVHEAEGYRAPADVRRSGNHLVGEPSPYLREHAHNPVDWYPWSDDALARARELDRPIFLSIGYSTCHWCRVMEGESFEDDAVAELLNRHFVSIKVDREQRPDIDALYMEAARLLGSPTGWPLNLFLTPDLTPFFGGTYFPRRASGGQPGFVDVLRQVHARYAEEGRARVGARGRRVFERIRLDARRLGGEDTALADVVDRSFSRLAAARDPHRGGFGVGEKFPNAPLLLAELRRFDRTGDGASRAHVITTLEQMTRGGIRDHLAGTLHRYATDPRWHVPHFEKTLYDNAQLAQLFVEAGLLLERADFVAAGRAILDDLIASWQRPDGGFAVGFDADDPRGEGRYYTWTPAELRAALTEQDAARFATLFGVTPDGERALGGRSVLHRIDPAAARMHLEMSEGEVDAFVARVAPALRRARAGRPPPAMDDKELVAWNGLAMGALATAGRWLDEPRYVRAAQRVARFIVDRCFEGGRLSRGRRAGASLGEGFLDDHALAALGLLRLHAADGDPRWLLEAHRLAQVIGERFFDPSLGAFMQTARDAPEALPVRRMDLGDGAMPSGGAAAILLFLELGAMAGDRAIYGIGERAARAAAPRAVDQPSASGYLLVALDHALSNRREVVIAADDAALWELVRRTSRARVLPIRVSAAGASDALVARFGALRGKVAIDGRATAYVCELGRCELPTSSPAELSRQLRALEEAPSLVRDDERDGDRAPE